MARSQCSTSHNFVDCNRSYGFGENPAFGAPPTNAAVKEMQGRNHYQNRFYPSTNRLGAEVCFSQNAQSKKSLQFFFECQGTASTTPPLPGNPLSVIPPTASIRYRDTVIFIITIHPVLLLLILIVLFFCRDFFRIDHSQPSGQSEKERDSQFKLIRLLKDAEIARRLVSSSTMPIGYLLTYVNDGG